MEEEEELQRKYQSSLTLLLISFKLTAYIKSFLHIYIYMYIVEIDSVNMESKFVTAVHVMAAELEVSTFRHESLSDFNSVIWAVVLLDITIKYILVLPFFSIASFVVSFCFPSHGLPSVARRILGKRGKRSLMAIQGRALHGTQPLETTNLCFGKSSYGERSELA